MTFPSIIGSATLLAIIALILWLSGMSGIYVSGSPAEVQSFIQSVTPVGAILLHALPFAFALYYYHCICQMEWITKPVFRVIAVIVVGLYVASNISTGVAKEAVGALMKSVGETSKADPKGYWGR